MYGTLNHRRLQFLRYTLDKQNPKPFAREYEALSKGEEMALEMEREKFRNKFKCHWTRWLEENSGSGWRKKEWRKNTMANAEGPFPVRDVENKEFPLAKSKKKNKLKLSISPKSKSRATRKNSSDSESEKDKKEKSKKLKNKETSSSESEDDLFINDILSSRPPPYNLVPLIAPDPMARGDGAQGSQEAAVVDEGVNQALAMTSQPSAPPQTAPSLPLLQTAVEASETTDEGASASLFHHSLRDQMLHLKLMWDF